MTASTTSEGTNRATAGGRPRSSSASTRKSSVKLRALGAHIFAGGFSVGVEHAGFELLGHLERSSYGVREWRAYRPKVPVTVDKAGKWSGAAPGQVDLLYANPPCAPWSVTSVGYKRQLDSPLIDWTKDVFALTRSLRPRVTVIESVRGASQHGAEMYRRLAAEHDLSLSWLFVNAYDHGLPQWRPRLFMAFQPAKEGVFVPEWRPKPPPLVLDVIGDPPRSHGEPISPKSIYAPGQGIKPEDLIACIPIIKPGKRLNQCPSGELAAALAEKMERVKFTGHMLARLRADKPCPVIYGLARYVHPTEDRLLTLRELMRLQGYPDDFEFKTDQATALRMLGKTVCPPVGEWVAAECAAHLRGERDVRYLKEAVFNCSSDAPRREPSIKDFLS